MSMMYQNHTFDWFWRLWLNTNKKLDSTTILADYVNFLKFYLQV